MTKDLFITEVNKLGIEVSAEELNNLDVLCDELIEYNKNTNLTALKSREDIYLKHFYDSLTIVKAINLKKVNTLIDVGTGAGFPGLVLKIFFPNLNITLLDSNNKKTKWLHYISEKLNIEVTIVNDRIESFSKTKLNFFDVVTARAVANLRILSELCIPLAKKDGIFCPLKGNIDSELKESIETISLMDSEVVDIINFDLYQQSGNRNILIIKKNKETNQKFLRTYEKILKKPLKNNHK